jgi:hypothetical protein
MTIARLAAWTVAIAPGGIGRVGVYKPIGPNQAILVTQSGPLDAASNNAWRDSLVTPQTIEPGFYYFAWSLNNTTSRFAGLAGGTYHGIFNRNSRYPTTASCTERMNDTDGLPSNCTFSTENGISLIAVLAFAD